jgi:hypothetical protein
VRALFQQGRSRVVRPSAQPEAARQRDGWHRRLEEARTEVRIEGPYNRWLPR